MDDKNKCCLLIGSQVNGKVALDILVKSFGNNHNMNTLIVIGGSTEVQPCEKIRNNIYVSHVKHNSIDYTALIAVLEHLTTITKVMNFEPTTWFFMHDTCEFTNFDLFEQICRKNNETIPLLKYVSMNMGIYTQHDILSQKDVIMKFRSTDNPKDNELINLKRNAMKTEDFLFKLLNVRHKSLSSKINAKEGFHVYPGSNVKRIVELFPQIGFQKYKANYGRPGIILNI
jgi:hypothetical protein